MRPGCDFFCAKNPMAETMFVRAYGKQRPNSQFSHTFGFSCLFATERHYAGHEMIVRTGGDRGPAQIPIACQAIGK